MSLKIDRVQLEIVIQQDQARQKMIELEERMRSANRELQKTKKQFGETSEEYKQQANVLKQLQQEYDNLYEEIGLTNLSLRDLGKRQKDLNAILRQLNPNTELYKQYSEQLKEVNNRIKELRGTANETRFSLSKLTDGFNKYGAIAASAIAGLTGITLTMRSCVNEYAEMEEAQSQVIKYTGLTKDEVKELNEEFKQMDTRTARTRLNELAGDAGKLGISTKEGVKEFVEAADMINVALGEDLGKEAITQIGKLADMFGTDDRSLKENMLAVGSAVNSVAQNSSAAEPYLVEFTARMGGVGKQANMAITDIMGFASALDQNMLRSEMASTALSGLILKLYQEPSKYAQLAGLQVEEFTKLMSEDVNEAVLTFLEALNRMGGMDKMAPVLDKMSLSGAEAASVISALAGSVEKVRKEQLGANQAFVEGTSVVNEFNVQNSTVQAELDKAKKRFADIRVELGEQLLPVMKYMVSTGSLTVKGLSAVLSVLAQYKGVIGTSIAVISSYTVAVKLAQLWEKRQQETFLLNVAAMKLKNVWTKTITAGEYLYMAAVAASTGKIQIATRVMKIFFNTLRLNPLGAVISLVTALGIGLYSLMSKTNEVKKVFSEFFERFESERVNLTKTYRALISTAEGTQSRIEMIEEFNQKFGEYLPNLLTEKSTLDEIKKAYEQVTSAMQSKIARQMLEEETTRLHTESLKKSSSYLVEVQKLLSKGLTDGQLAKVMPKIVSTVDELTKKGYSVKKINDAIIHSLSRTYDTLNLRMKNGQLGVGVLSDVRGELEDYIEEVQETANKVQDIKKRLNPFINVSDTKPQQSATNILPEVVVTPQNISSGIVDDGGLDKILQKRQAELDKSMREEQNTLKRQRQLGLIEEEEYQSKMYEIQVKFLSLRKELLDEYGKDSSALEGQLLDILIAEADRKNQKMQADKERQLRNEISAEKAAYTKRKIELQRFYASYKISKKEFDTEMEKLEMEHMQNMQAIQAGCDSGTCGIEGQIAAKGVAARNKDEEQRLSEGIERINSAMSEKGAMKELQYLYDEGLLSYEEFEKKKTEIADLWEQRRGDIRDNAFRAARSVLQSLGSLMSAMQDKEISKIEERYDAQIEAAQKAGKDTTELEEQKEQEIWEVKKKYADKQFAVTVLDIIANTASAIMVAWKAGPILGPILGAAAAAQGAMQLAVAQLQREQAAGLYTGGYSDDYVQGYTAKGDSHDVAGVIPVHKNEFVTNHEGVANPHVKQFLDVFDIAQKNGTIGMLNTTQILQQVRVRSGRYSGGYTDDTTNPIPVDNGGFSSSEILAWIKIIAKELQKSNIHLSAIAAKDLTVNVRSVRDGIKRLEMLEKNASR